MKKPAPLLIVLCLLFITSIICCGNCQASKPIKESSDSAEQWRKPWLTPQEQLWLSQNKVIMHGMVGGKRHKPFEYTDDTGKHQGLTSDYLKIISEKLGIEIRSSQRFPRFMALANALRAKEIDFASYLPLSLIHI